MQKYKTVKKEIEKIAKIMFTKIYKKQRGGINLDEKELLERIKNKIIEEIDKKETWNKEEIKQIIINECLGILVLQEKKISQKDMKAKCNKCNRNNNGWCLDLKTNKKEEKIEKCKYNEIKTIEENKEEKEFYE